MAVTILTSDNPQTVINANPTDGEVFTFEAGTHNVSGNLVPSNNNQQFLGVMGGAAELVTPLGPDGASLGKTKQLWPATHQTTIDGGGGAHGFIMNYSPGSSFSGIRIANLKIQNFDPAVSPGGVVGGKFMTDQIIEDCWIDGGSQPIQPGEGTIVRRNRVSNARVCWLAQWYSGWGGSGSDPSGTLAKPVIIEDNDVYDVNLTEEGGASVGHVQNHAGFKISGGCEYVIVRRNYIRNCHGPAIWFDGWADGVQIYDNITVDCGINDFSGSGGDMPHIFYEINWSSSHLGALIHNNWCLGFSAHIRSSHCHGSYVNPILIYENTVDCDDSDRQGIHLTGSGRTDGGDSTAGHPVIDNTSLPAGSHFNDHVKVCDNVVRKRNAAFNQFVPLAGTQNTDMDTERNFEWNGNKYEVNSAITTPFNWGAASESWATWRTHRAAANDVANAGPLFDAAGSYVTWSGAKQFSDTENGWEQATRFWGVNDWKLLDSRHPKTMEDRRVGSRVA